MRTTLLSLIFIFIMSFPCIAQRKQRVTATIGFGVSPLERLGKEVRNEDEESFRNEYPEGILFSAGYEVPLVHFRKLHTLAIEPRFTYGYYKAYPDNRRYYYANVLQAGVIPRYYYDISEGDGQTLIAFEAEFSLSNISGRATDTGYWEDSRNANAFRMFSATFRAGVVSSRDGLDVYPWIGVSSLRFRKYLNSNLPENAKGYGAQEALFSVGITFKFL